MDKVFNKVVVEIVGFILFSLLLGALYKVGMLEADIKLPGEKVQEVVVVIATPIQQEPAQQVVVRVTPTPTTQAQNLVIQQVPSTACQGWSSGEVHVLQPGQIAVGDVEVDGIIRYDSGGAGEGTVVVNASSREVSIYAPWGASCTTKDKVIVIDEVFQTGCGSSCVIVRLVTVSDYEVEEISLKSDNCVVLAFDAHKGEEVPAGWVLHEKVDNLAKVIELSVLNLTSPARAHIDGFIHNNYWHYCSEFGARQGQDFQRAAREKELSTPNSWANGYTITVR